MASVGLRGNLSAKICASVLPAVLTLPLGWTVLTRIVLDIYASGFRSFQPINLAAASSEVCIIAATYFLSANQQHIRSWCQKMISPAKQRLTTLAKLFVSVLTYLSQTLMPKYSQYEHLQSPINCQAQPKVQTNASAFGWDGYIIIIIQPPTHPLGQVWRRRDRAKHRKQKLFVRMSRP